MEEFDVLKAIYGDDFKVLGPADGEHCGLECKINESNLLQFIISDDFPSVKPKVKLISSRKDVELVEKLVTESCSSKEDSYLYDAIEVARNWLLHNSDQVCADDNACSKGKTVCKFFVEGKCRFGESCFNKHPINANNKNNDILRQTQKYSNEIRDDEMKKKATIKLTEGEGAKTEGAKKKSMKTAIDVISRILWDDALPTDQFSVGYLDRFIGIVEKPFSSFSWEDIASVDYSTLAIPKHRIQYFKYKDVIVWDKQTRLDKVFGSTGNAKEIYEIVQSYQKSQADNLDSDKPGSTISNENKEFSDDETDDTSDEVDEINSVVSGPTNATKVWRNEKDRPNYFFCFRVHESSIKKKIYEVQQEIVSCNSMLEDGCLKPSEIHVTLCMLRLNNDDEKEKARKLLETMQPILVCMLPTIHQLSFENLGNFRGRVLHVEVSSDSALSKFVSILLLKLKDAGLHSCGNREHYRPHATMLKLSRPMCRTLSQKHIDSCYYQHHLKDQFGKQSINEIFLCSTSKLRDEDGFYVQLGSKSNSLLCISDRLPNVIANHVNVLMERSIFTEEEGDRLVQGLLSGDEHQFESIVCHLENLFKERPDTKLEQRNVYILRGLQGSGKSYLAKNCVENLECSEKVFNGGACVGENELRREEFVICSADDYFDSRLSGYNFSASELASAHTDCRRKFIDAIGNEVANIVVDNTNSQTWEYQIYERIAVLCGYSSHVIEIACRDGETLKRFLERSQHKVDRDSVHRMWNKWEPDKKAIMIDPDFGDESKKMSLVELSRKNNPSQVRATEVLFSGLFLDSISRKRLLDEYPPLHSRIAANHMTFAYKPMKEEISHIPVGDPHSATVIGYVRTDLMQAVAVKENKDAYCSIEVPHITIAHSKKAAPQHAKLALANKAAWQMPDKELVLTGTIGAQVAIGLKRSIVITDPVIYADACKQINEYNTDHVGNSYPSSVVNNLKKTTIQADEIPSLHFGSEEITSLFVFDFDGTLFKTPDPVIGRKQYQELAGENWPHGGWIGRPESLQWPLHSYPGPSFVDFKEHIGRAGSLTILLTGRLERTAAGVYEVLREYGIHPDRCFLKPDDNLSKASRAMAQVSSFKTDVIKGLLKEYPTITTVKTWDDRQDNIDAFRRLRKEYSNVQFELFKVGEEKKSKNKLSKEGFSEGINKMVDDFGFGSTNNFDATAEQGIRFITSAWNSCNGSDRKTDDTVLRQFGSYQLRRVGDVDLCILVPCSMSQDECILKLEMELTRRGVRHIHAATGIKCPRLKLRLFFDKMAPVDFDIVFAPCLSLDCKLPASLTEIFENGSNDIKAALEGVIFLERVQDCISRKVTVDDFGKLIDVIVHYLKSKHLKGNAFHCLRTFHVVRALAEMVSKSKAPCQNFSSLIKRSFEYLCSLDVEYWRRICKDMVPEEIIERTVESFVSAVKMLNQSEPCSTLFAVTKFPPPNHTVISLTAKSHLSELRWRGSTILEAKLGRCLRKLLSVGVEIVPGPCDYKNTFLFAIPSNERNMKVCQSTISSLKLEPIFLQNRNDLELILNFGDFKF